MAWKEVVRRQWVEEGGFQLGELWVNDGQRVTVIVEEEDRKCCERWRGCGEVWTRDRSVPGYKYTVPARVTFCPECGRKL